MNWGKVTALILAVFVVFIGWMSYVMFRSPADEYDHQYYENGLNFDHDYNREQQVTKDHAQPLIAVDSSSVKLTFPQLIKGNVIFMRPSSDAADNTFQLDNKDGRPITLPTNKLAKGKWQLVFAWRSNNSSYLYHQEIYVK